MPIHPPTQVEGNGRPDFLQVRFGQTAIARLTQPEGAHGLRDRALHLRTSCIFLAKRRGLLIQPRLL